MADTAPSVKKYYDFAQQQVDEQALLDKFNAATTAQFNLQREQNRQAENQFYNQMYNTQQTAMDTIRQSNAAAVSTGASRGVQAAQELSALLGLQQESVASATELANANRQTAQEETAAVLENVLNAYQQAEQQRQNLITAGIQSASVDTEAASSQAQTNATNKQTVIAAYENGVEAGNAAAANIVNPEVPTTEGQALLDTALTKMSNFNPDMWNDSNTGSANADIVEAQTRAICSTYGLNYSDFEQDISKIKEAASEQASLLGALGNVIGFGFSQGSLTKTQAAELSNIYLTKLRSKLQNAYAARLSTGNSTGNPTGPKHGAKK